MAGAAAIAANNNPIRNYFITIPAYSRPLRSDHTICAGNSAVTSRQQIAGVFPSADATSLQRR